MNTTANTTVEMFTPGPWEVDGFDLVSVIVNERPESNHPAWKHIVKCDYGYSVPEKHFEENKANAKLIAAAPDLYESLKAITDFAKGYFFTDDTKIKATISGETLRKAFAAIKKATE